MSIATTREQRRALERENARRPLCLQVVPRDEWPDRAAIHAAGPQKVWRSRHYLVQLFPAPAPAIGRLSIARTSIAGNDWADGITWDDLQRLKTEAGYENTWAVEVFPAICSTVNVANMRHLWLLETAPDFAWKNPNDHE